MIQRCFLLIAACAAGLSCLALLPAGLAQGAARPPWGTPMLGARQPGLRPGGLMGGCEQRLERSQRQAGADVPALAIVGASFTAGVGPGNPGRSWAVLLTHLLHRNAVVYGDPGAGYVRAGIGRKGPVAAELTRIGLRALAPALSSCRPATTISGYR